MSERTFLIKGDFDFLVHSLEGSTLEEVLTNENISPFIYFGNFDIKANKKYDIIGEIKENSGYQDISQVKKYLHLLYNLEKHPEFNDEMKFRKENKKIMMYVFNHSFQRFIENILDFKINREKFKNMKNFQYECFHNIVGYIEKKDKVKDNPRSLLMKIVIESGLPFVFIFVDNMKSMMDINQMDKIDSDIKTKELEKQVDDLRKEMEQKDLENKKIMEKKDLENRKIIQKIMEQNDFENKKKEEENKKKEEENKKKEKENEKRFSELEALIRQQSEYIKALKYSLEQQKLNNANNIKDDTTSPSQNQ